ncbi:MAG TPA: DeoR/GlpR transcriptional regulator [Lachnospiraceae bacterium]|nr:DeoR/GlpR transcriptional regulator [Lachnospiraceae bacterium]
MLTEKRYEAILDMIKRNRTVSVQELTEKLGISESTARRDLTALDNIGKIKKVYGGAVALTVDYATKDLSMTEKSSLYFEEKDRIAKYAAALIRPDDFVFIDAGTTTQLLTEHITQTQAVYVTNSLKHASILAGKGCRTILLGGELKNITEALVGSETVDALQKYNFTIGFFGTNGADEALGCTTPDISEAMVKKNAIFRCARAYVLCDHSKFHKISPVTFARFNAVTFITDKITIEKYKGYNNIVEVE